MLCIASNTTQLSLGVSTDYAADDNMNCLDIVNPTPKLLDTAVSVKTSLFHTVTTSYVCLNNDCTYTAVSQLTRSAFGEACIPVDKSRTNLNQEYSGLFLCLEREFGFGPRRYQINLIDEDAIDENEICIHLPVNGYRWETTRIEQDNGATSTLKNTYLRQSVSILLFSIYYCINN
jgi:hypothetical protein